MGVRPCLCPNCHCCLDELPGAVLGGTAGNFPFEEEGVGGSSPHRDVVKGLLLQGYACTVVVIDFNYLPRGLTGNERTGRGLTESYWFDTHSRKPGTSRERGDAESFGGEGFILEYL